jgi:hypothetical protein
MFLAAFTSALQVYLQAVHRKTAWLSRDFPSTCPHAEQRWLVWCGLIFSTLPGALFSRRPTSRPHGTLKKASAAAGTFDLLGFTHYWGRSWRGFWVVKRRTASDRMHRALHRIGVWCRRHYHRPIAEQQQTLGPQLRGHYAYYGITGNREMLARFRYAVVRLWQKWLGRRQRHGYFSWADFTELLKRFPLPPVRVVHSVYRLAAKP